MRKSKTKKKRRKRKILFINPKYPTPLSLTISPLGLLYVAAYTPKSWKKEALDENLCALSEEKLKTADLVALTALTSNAPRAYEIADWCKKLRVKTVMGGIHASMCLEEALQHVDFVIKGEAEGKGGWQEFIKDFEKDKAKRFYEAERPSLKNLRLPAYELCSKNYRAEHLVQTSRGCPNNCEFCSVTVFNGSERRKRPIKEVIKEIKTRDPRLGFGPFKNKFIFFVDDNIIDREDLFKEMKGLGYKWAGQVDSNISDKQLKLAAKSGCQALFVGFESLDKESLIEMKKGVNIKNLDRYKDLVKLIHSYGIAVVGSFMVGTDNDTPKIFKQMKEFIYKHVDLAQITVYTPLPGTKLYSRLKKAGRKLAHDWRKYNFGQPVHEAKLIKPKEIVEGISGIYSKLSPVFQASTRAFKSFVITGNPIMLLMFKWNRKYGKGFLNYYKNLEINLN